jgi:ribosomal protein L3 glutamine methyltransferase
LKTIRDALLDATQRFDEAGLAYGHGTANALDEAAWIVLHAAGLPPRDLQRHLEDPLTPQQLRAARALVAKRIRTRKPAAYLLNEAWLGPHRFYVDERVIVPRSFIGEMLLGNWGQTTFSGRKSASAASGKSGLSPISVLDLCTGSGCLAILAALRFKSAAVDAADISPDALAVAKRNVADYGLQERVRLVQSDLFAALAGRTYDLIVSNPPYVKAASMKKLPDEYRKEPVLALASGNDGLAHTRAIMAQARAHLAPGGKLVVEIGHNRKALEKAFPRLPFRWPKVAAGTGFVFVLQRESLP